MYGVEVLVNEHDQIMRMANVMRRASLHVLNGGDLVVQDFDHMVDFVRNYADQHHHRKEEKLLFDYMVKELGNIGINLVKHGMLVEHDLGRLYMAELDQALRAYENDADNSDAKLDIITNTTAYTYLIKRHIAKENEVVFTFGEKNLKEESKAYIDKQTKIIEEEAQEIGVQVKYMGILEELEKKYLV
ncbi:hemerythrin domain-containing protein [Anaerosporobacter faecicola]|uniref:hemerythrin domain-containing protein n=1 Tax=Anaerosporobacter faecicola TaxID=2718714 RepID=UPI00143AE992|nr:hemerythrin domain-containing protein [Anaerosporobacter faecicola]